MSNSIGQIFKLTTFGESHGEAIGGIIEGCPAGLEIDLDYIQQQLNRRKPGQSKIASPRKEADEVQILSGVFEGKTIGSPIGFMIKNKDQNPTDYHHLKEVYRPSHADYTYEQKYGLRDYRGGGRASARETAARVVGGAVAAQFNSLYNLQVFAFVSSVGKVKLNKNYSKLDLSAIDDNMVRCPDEETAELMIEQIERARQKGDSLGGTVTCVIKNVPAGLGEPVFNKLHAALGFAMLGINAVKGFEYGSGFKGAAMYGSEHNDEFYKDSSGNVKTKTNYSGGIQGGISNGMDVYFRVAFKPVATIFKEQKTLDKNNNSTILKAKGRHDPCVVPRAVPVVEAMAHLVFADFLLMAKLNRV